MNSGTILSALSPTLSSAADITCKSRGADVRAEGEAEIDEHEAAAEILVGHRFAGVVDEFERPADQRLAGRWQRRQRSTNSRQHRDGDGGTGHKPDERDR